MGEITMVKRWFQLDIKELAYVKFILESYEGVAMQRTLNASRGEIEIMVPSCNVAVLDEIISDLKGSTDIREIKKPVDYSALFL